ncbi:MAG TPA: DUF4145 domain-containing protein [Aestuariivirga sp.]|nr:DUF4145 domain-containing protein [Aestuariivirga sp.]
MTARTDGKMSSMWAAFRCTTCGSIVTARGAQGENVSNAMVSATYPDVWEADDVLPETVKKYLDQAHQTKASPDASVVMSAAAIDAMLKDKKLTEGTLYSRIDKAVTDGLLTKVLADWAHRVRLDSNTPRHADSKTPHLTSEESDRAFDFALSEYLYVLPSRIPPEPATPTSA